MKFDYGTSSDEVIALIIEGITELTARNKGEDRHWLGVGIGVSGLVNKQKGELIYSRLLGWNRVPFRKILQENFRYQYTSTMMLMSTL